MTHTFALRSSDNALVWVKNPPDPLPDHFSSDKVEKLYREEYQSALTQAIADGIRVADESKVIAKIWDVIKGTPHEATWETLKLDTVYALDVEMKTKWQYAPKDYAPELCDWLDCTIKERYPEEFQYRQLAYLVPKEEPKQEGGRRLLEWIDGELAELRLWDSSFIPNGSEQAKSQIRNYEAFRAKTIELLTPAEPKEPETGMTMAELMNEVIYLRKIAFPRAAEPKEDIEFFKTSTPRPKMTNEDTRKRITNIIRENITFSGQIGDYIIHGAIEKLCDLIDENNRAWRDFHEQAEPKEEQTELLLAFKKWYDSLTPRDKCTVWPPAGSGAGHGLYNQSDEDLIQKFIHRK